MSEKTRTVLKAYFETNDQPTESEFSDFIDSCPNMSTDGILVGLDSAITAFAGGGQANATQLTKRVNVVSVCATLNDSVKLPNTSAGSRIFVMNVGVANCMVYPYEGGQISGGGVNNPVLLTVANILEVTNIGVNDWY